MANSTRSDRRRSHERLSRTGTTYEQRDRSKANREGTIYQRKDKGIWCAAITLANGTRKYVYGPTREDVAEKLTQALSDRRNGIAPPNQRETVGSWLTQYVDDLEARGTAHGTVVRYKGILRNHVMAALGRYRLAQLQPQHIQSYQADLLKQGSSAKTITLHRSLLGGALKQAVSFGLISRNVVALVKPPREDKDNKGTMLTPQEGRALLGAVRGDRNEAFYFVLLTAGLRRGEALGLQWSDLELNGPSGGVVHVRHQLQWPKGVPSVVPVKTRQGIRTIPLPHMTVEALLERRASQANERTRIGDRRWQAGDLVFNSEQGAPLHRTTITKQFLAHLKRSGMRPLRLHDLRHTYGSLLMSQGVPLKTISDLLGHASIEVTADIYLHSLDVQVRDTARMVENALAAPLSTTGDAPYCPTCGQPVTATGPDLVSPNGQTI
jgi:integrase